MLTPRIPTAHDEAIRALIAATLNPQPKPPAQQWPHDAPQISDGAIRQAVAFTALDGAAMPVRAGAAQ